MDREPNVELPKASFQPLFEIGKEAAVLRRIFSVNEDAVEASVRQIVLAAYQLDSSGDIGDGQKVQEAFATFNAAVTALDALVAGHRR